jgi:thiamine biosynthesis lipoprotein
MTLLERLPLTPSTRQWDVWSTVARLVVTDERCADEAERVIRAELAAVDAACSRFRPDSELAVLQRRVDAAGVRLAVEVTPLLADLVGVGLQAAERSGGDVDPTLADALTALGYDRDFARVEQLGLVHAGGVPVRLTRSRRPSWREIRLAGRMLTLPPGVHLDLGATAKARAADRCAALVAERLGCGVLVGLGGDLAAAGPAPAVGWQVLVQDGAGQPAGRIALHRGGLATSSTLSRRWHSGTRSVHHILDPAVGRPAREVWRTVSVAAGSCVAANTASTACIVRGEGALEWIRHGGRPARLVTADGRVLTCGGWPAERPAEADAETREHRRFRRGIRSETANSAARTAILPVGAVR